MTFTDRLKELIEDATDLGWPQILYAADQAAVRAGEDCEMATVQDERAAYLDGAATMYARVRQALDTQREDHVYTLEYLHGLMKIADALALKGGSLIDLHGALKHLPLPPKDGYDV